MRGLTSRTTETLGTHGLGKLRPFDVYYLHGNANGSACMSLSSKKGCLVAPMHITPTACPKHRALRCAGVIDLDGSRYINFDGRRHIDLLDGRLYIDLTAFGL